MRGGAFYRRLPWPFPPVDIQFFRKVFRMSFVDLRLIEPLLRALKVKGYSSPTPIQAQAIPLALQGRDMLGCAQTGTGKTAAFGLPILQRFAAGSAPAPTAGRRGLVSHPPRALILCPTRELATQIDEEFAAYGRFLNLSHTVIFGGVNQHSQVTALRRGVDIIVATPGRLMDLMEQGHVDLSCIQILVLDEADRMLDMGFIHDIRRIVGQLPAKRQTMLFSATMPTEIRQLADSLLDNPATVQVAAVWATADNIDQSVYHVQRHDKPALLAHLVGELPMTRAIVFTRTKHGADRIVRQLHLRGIHAVAIHGNKTQNARQRALDGFKAGRTGVLVATDIASRGIDVDGITHVVNYDLPNEPETYVHRIGRTARAGAAGSAVSFCGHEEQDQLRAIQRLIRRPIPVAIAAQFQSASAAAPQASFAPVRPALPNHRPHHAGIAAQLAGHRPHHAADAAHHAAHRPQHAAGAVQPAAPRPQHQGQRPQAHVQHASAPARHPSKHGGVGRPQHHQRGSSGRPGQFRGRHAAAAGGKR